MSEGLPVMLDASPGVDAALAIYLALADPALELQGISTTFGSTSVVQATRNALYLCAIAGRRIPVASGVGSPMRKAPRQPDTDRHGTDGLGNLPARQQDVHDQDERSAARLIVDTARAHPGALTLVTAGPLGNLVQAMRLEPHLPQMLRQVIVVGGSITEPGDVSPVAESNMWHDPHAADIVLTAGFALTLLGLDVTHRLPLPLALFERIAARQTHPATDTLLHVLRYQASHDALLYPDLARLQACHAPAMSGLLYLVQPELFKTMSGRVRVVPEGLAEGQTILDRCEHIPYAQAGWGEDIPKIEAGLHVDTGPALDRLDATLTRNWLNQSGTPI